jgi:cytidyltransferase-like protein
MGFRRFLIIFLLGLVSWSALANSDLWNFPYAEKSINQRIGWYPGSYDPPHNGHLNIIETAIRELDLDTIYITVNGMTNKEYKSSIAERVRMVKAMVKGRFPNVNVVVSVEPMHGKRPLIKNFMDLHGQNNVHAIFGSDTLQLNWGRMGDIDGFKYVLMSRPGYKADTKGVDQSRLVYVNGGPGVFSSSKVREDILNTGGSSLLGDDVNYEVARMNLYQALSINEFDYYVAKRFFIYQRLRRKFPELKMPKEALVPLPLQSESAYDDLIIRQMLQNNPDLEPNKQKEVYRFFQALLSADNQLLFRKQHARNLEVQRYQKYTKCFSGLYRMMKASQRAQAAPLRIRRRH